MSRYRTTDTPNVSETASVPIRKVEPGASTALVARELEAHGLSLTTMRLGQYVVNGPGLRKKFKGHRQLVQFIDSLRVAAGKEPIMR